VAGGEMKKSILKLIKTSWFWVPMLPAWFILFAFMKIGEIAELLLDKIDDKADEILG
jgi:hypothetical protein